MSLSAPPRPPAAVLQARIQPYSPPRQLPAVANTGTIQTSLDAGNAVTIHTASAAGGNGDLTVADSIIKSGGASSTLTLNAVRDHALNAALSSNSGALPIVLNAGRNVTNSQPITTNGGNLTVNPVQTFTMDASVDAGTGEVLIESGSVESAANPGITGSSVQVAEGAAIRLHGTGVGPSDCASGTVSPGPGAAPGMLQVNGDVTLQSTATTAIQVGGTSQGFNYDLINATGAVTVAGALQVTLVNNFHDTIDGSHVFPIIQGNSVTGTFTGYPDWLALHAGQ